MTGLKARFLLDAAATERKKSWSGPVHVGKREPIQSTLSTKESSLLVARHGLTGPLPSHLDRASRMKVYEARYHAAGGPKGEKWAHRAKGADAVKTGGLLGATAAGAGLLAARTKRGTALLKTAHAAKIRHHSETAGLVAATAGGAGELAGDYARRKQSRYTSAPAGVAAGALRRMQAYPGGK